jgi:hypothetical protein
MSTGAALLISLHRHHLLWLVGMCTARHQRLKSAFGGETFCSSQDSKARISPFGLGEPSGPKFLTICIEGATIESSLTAERHGYGAERGLLIGSAREC